VPFVVADALKGFHAEGWKGAGKPPPGAGVNLDPKRDGGRRGAP
jgi:hypothetical protein